MSSISSPESFSASFPPSNPSMYSCRHAGRSSLRKGRTRMGMSSDTPDMLVVHSNQKRQGNGRGILGRPRLLPSRFSKDRLGGSLALPSYVNGKEFQNIRG